METTPFMFTVGVWDVAEARKKLGPLACTLKLVIECALKRLRGTPRAGAAMRLYKVEEGWQVVIDSETDIQEEA